MDFSGKNLLRIRGMTRGELEGLFKAADRMAPVAREKRGLKSLDGQVLANLFFESSTRTRFSFDTAMLRLGGSVIGFSGGAGTSLDKGESFEDTIKMVEQYANGIVIRHPEPGAAARAAEVASIPIINAGDGHNEHPTQAILDTYTISREKSLDGIKVLITGDLKYGRTVHSLAYALSLFDSVELQLFAPPELSFPQEILDEISGKVKITQLDSFDVSSADVVYATRIQKERLANPADAKEYVYRIDAATMEEMKPDAMLMHPLPRVGEIAEAVDSDPRAAYFREAANGLPVRMALLEEILG
ncbi:aspartate carbamoyltransferase [Candidatus Micrarchaeota archaeon CG1_02_55_22]|nr:MAG: aspartate carbamoyltransferase [Candidatus Micrarchaeota archaeon CG1_02_55_22]